MVPFRKIVVIVMDSVGIGEAPDADQYGDRGAHTLGHIAAGVARFHVPHLAQMGLGNIAELTGIAPAQCPTAYYGKMREVSAGKDTMTGHWELMGLHVTIPFRTYPHGFPATLMAQFARETGRKVIGNKVASGTIILDELGREQMESGAWIVYTSADSVLQIAAHEDIIPLTELYHACEVARRLTMSDEYAVGRVIARPYVGQPGQFIRTSHRHDYAVPPPEPTALDFLYQSGLQVVSVGKIHDIFCGHGITASFPTKGNEEGISQTIERTKEMDRGLVFCNLVDFDSLYGHRRDPQGYAQALMAFDRRLPEIMSALGTDDLLIITADHGNDPYHHGTDHTREFVPLLAWHRQMDCGASLGTRETFADLAATILSNFGLPGTGHGIGFLDRLIRKPVKRGGD